MGNSKQNIVEDAERYVFELFKTKLSSKFVYHNFQHTSEIVENCKKIAKAYPVLSDSDIEILLLAAWFHDAGYVKTYKGHEEESKVFANDFLKEKNYPEEKISKVLNCIDATKRETAPTVLINQIMVDADIANIGEKKFFSRGQLLREEWDNFGISHCTDEDWAKSQRLFLESSNFQTQEAERLFGAKHQKNIQKQFKKLSKITNKKLKKIEKEQKIKAQPKRGIETMFRSIYKNHISLSAIADNKANMMISINSLLISITLTLVGAKLSFLGASFKANQIVIYPVISLLLTSLGAIIFAILSAKPKITHKIHSMDDLTREKISILFFGNYTWFTIEEFEHQMRELMKSEDSLYGNMIRDIYYLGQVLVIKYKLIRISYLVFMFGLIITVLTTVFVIIHLKQKDDLPTVQSVGLTNIFF